MAAWGSLVDVGLVVVGTCEIKRKNESCRRALML